MCDVVDHGDDFADGQFTAADGPSADPQDGEDAEIHEKHHGWHHAGHEACRAYMLIRQCFIGVAELLIFVIFADEGLHDADSRKILLRNCRELTFLNIRILEGASNLVMEKERVKHDYRYKSS